MSKRTKIELFILVIPGIWMLLMSSNYARWNYGFLSVIGSIFIGIGYLLWARKYGKDKKPWAALYVGMILWSFLITISWILSDRATMALLRMAHDVFPASLRSIFWITLSVGILFLIWQAIKSKNWNTWLYLILHSCILGASIWLLNTSGSYGQCVGVFSLLSNLPCRFFELLGFGGFFVLGTLLIALPTVLAVQYKNSFGNRGTIVVLAMVPAWIEIFVFPMQALGEPLLQIFQNSRFDSHHLSALIDGASFAQIFFFMLLIPIGLFFIESEKRKGVWSVVLSSLALVILLVIYARGISALGFQVLDSWGLTVMLFFSLGQILLSMYVITKRRITPDLSR